MSEWDEVIAQGDKDERRNETIRTFNIPPSRVGVPGTINIETAVAQRAIDAICRAHKATLQLDCARSVLNGKEEVEESPLTKALETSMNEMRQALEAAGIAW